MGESGFAAISSGFDLIGYFKAGGPMMYVLLIISIVAITFIIERLIVFMVQKKKLSPAVFLAKLDELIEGKKDKAALVQELVDLCEAKKGVAAEIFRTGLEKYQDAKNMKMTVIETKNWMIEGIQDRAKTELPQLDAHINILAICYTISPLVGLLGTVAGMIQSFMVMARSGGGAKPDELAGGIAVALLTTAGGLIVAIPTMIAHAFVRSRADSYVNQVEEAAMEMVDAVVGNEGV